MTSPFHPGELAVQGRAHVTAAARRVGGIIQSAVPAPVGAFLARQQFAILASADGDGAVWASLLTGDPGVFRAADPHTLRIAAPAADGGLTIRVREVYGNCPKYIQQRVLDPHGGGAPVPHVGGPPSRPAGLTDTQRAWITGADTCFLASLAPGRGADASQRARMPNGIWPSRRPCGLLGA
jgi:hypothetical protein